MFIPQLEIKAPVELGPPSRVFREYWRNWGIIFSRSEAEQVLAHGVCHFAKEYALSPDRMPSISTGSKAAFGRDYPKLLNDSNANVVSRIILNSQKRVKLLEFGTGSGNTIKAVYKKVVDDGGRSEWNKVEVTLVEPSRELLMRTSGELKDLGIQNSSLPIFAHEIPVYIHDASQDLVMEVASNHYPDPSLSFEAVRRVLKDDGAFVLSEWCYSVTEYPERFRSILEGLEWPSKEADLEAFDTVFCIGSRDVRNPDSGALRKANREFIDFYVEHVKAGIPYKTYSLKGHCPVATNIRYLHRSRFTSSSQLVEDLVRTNRISSNPHLILPGNELLVTIIGQPTAGM